MYANIVLGAANSSTIELEDITQNEIYTTEQQYQGPRANAEWILEKPYLTIYYPAYNIYEYEIPPLAQFNSSSYGPDYTNKPNTDFATINSVSSSINHFSNAAIRMRMYQRNQSEAAPSGLSGSGSFNVVYIPNSGTLKIVANTIGGDNSFPFNLNTIAPSAAVSNVAIGGLLTPFEVAMAPSGAYVYVVTYFPNELAIINTSTNIVTGVIGGFGSPTGVAIAPSGKYAYISNQGYDTLSIVNTATNQITGAIYGFNNPEGLAFAPNGAYAYVADYGSGNTLIVNTSSNEITGSIAGFQDPVAIGFAPSGAYAYVANAGNNTISIVNTSYKTIIGTIFGFSTPRVLHSIHKAHSPTL